MILDYENGIRREITRAFFTAQKQLNKYTLIYDELKESAYIPYLDFNNLYSTTYLNMLKIYQCLHLTLSKTMTKTAILVLH